MASLWSQSQHNWQVLPLSLVVIAGIIGNMLVCIAIYTEKKLQNITNYFLMSLAVADLFVCVIVMPLAIINDFMGLWALGLLMCDIWQVTDVMMCTSSIMHMCIISMDRYMAIRNPLNTRVKSSTSIGVKVATVWLISLATASPLIILSIVRPQHILNSDYQCGIFNQHFLIYGSLTAFFIPLSIMAVAYTLTIRLLHKQAVKSSKQGGIRRTFSRRKSRFFTTTANIKESSINGYNKIAKKWRQSSRNDAQNADPKEIVPLTMVSNESCITPGMTPCMTPSITPSPRPSLISNDMPTGATEEVGRRKLFSMSYSKPPNTCTSHRTSLDNNMCYMQVPSNVKSKSEADIRDNNEEENIQLQVPPPQAVHGSSSSVLQNALRKLSWTKLLKGNDDNAEQTQPNLKFRQLVKKHSAAFKVAGILMAKREQHNKVKTERKAIKVLGTMFITFVICWAPFFITNFTMGVCINCNIDTLLFKLFLWLGYVGSTLNPLIYTVFNNMFRQTFIRILTCGRYTPTNAEAKIAAANLATFKAGTAAYNIPNNLQHVYNQLPETQL